MISDVFRAFRNGQPGAIKLLRKNLWAGARYERFRSEVEAMQHCNDVPGVLPLLDMNCPDTPHTENRPWFVMGLAEPHATAETLQATLDSMKVVEEMRRTLREIRDVNKLDSN